MFLSILNFVMELGLVYLLTALFVILDLMLLSSRARRLRGEKKGRDEREVRREADEQQQRKAFEKRQAEFSAAQ
jgi:hypothetical protein